MRRGEVWLTQIGPKPRPVVVLTREEVLDVRELVTVAEVTTVRRGLSSEVAIDHAEIGLDQPSVVNADGMHTVKMSSLTRRIGSLSAETLVDVCWAVNSALGC